MYFHKIYIFPHFTYFYGEINNTLNSHQQPKCKMLKRKKLAFLNENFLLHFLLISCINTFNNDYLVCYKIKRMFPNVHV